MKENRFVCIAGLTLLAALTIPLHVSAQQPSYKLIDMGTLGGPASSFSNGNDGILNNRGTAVGWAETSAADPFAPFCMDADCFLPHAFKYQRGVLTDLGSLTAGVGSYAAWITANGLVVGASENGQLDPLVPGFPQSRGVIWKDGAITDLGTLPEGGYESVALTANDEGHVAGFALNTIPDLYSLAGPGFFPTQTRAFIWHEGTMRDLGTLGGNDAAAFFVNDRGQITGQSYTNNTPNSTTGLPTADSFFWENGTMYDICSLGGTLGNPSGFNNRGQVIGISNMAGDITSHPFLWSKKHGLQDLGTLGGENGVANWINELGDIAGKADLAGPAPQNHDAVLWRKNGTEMIDLGVLPGDACANAYYVNSRGQVVGTSENTDLCRIPTGEHAFLWENGGPMIDLNSLIPAGSSLNSRLHLPSTTKGKLQELGFLRAARPTTSASAVTRMC